MKYINTAHVIMWINILYWIGYNTYFGWNKTAITPEEIIFDQIHEYIFGLAIILFLMPLVKWYVISIKVLEGIEEKSKVVESDHLKNN